MAVELQHDGPNKFALAGLDLNVPPDLVPSTKYSRTTNIMSRVEGQIQTRWAWSSFSSTTSTAACNSLFRLNEYMPGISNELLMGFADGSLWAAGPVNLVAANTFDGAPLSIVGYRFDSDPAEWAIIGNSQGMFKHKPNYTQRLGVIAPTVAATATVGSSGVLTGNYDWRYTYVNPITQSESNGSPQMTSSVDINRPTAHSNWVVGLEFTNPTRAFDNNFTTFALGSNSAGVSMLLSAWPAASGVYSSLQLNINYALSAGGTGAALLIQYSLDGGNTAYTALTSNTSVAQNTLSVNLPANQDLTKLQVMFLIYSTFAGGLPTVEIYEVWTSGNLVPAVPTHLTLSSQYALICVAPPTDSQETSIRLYRRGGTLPDNWFMVAEFPVASLSQGSCGTGLLQIQDNVTDAAIEVNPILPQDNFPPIQSVQATNYPLPVIFGPYQGRLLACGDPARPESVYFSQAGNADIWGAESWIVTANPGEQMMNGIVYSLRCFAFSRERLYILLPGIQVGVTFTPSETSCRRGLKGRWALTAGEQGVYFVAKDGIYRTQGGPEQSIIDDSIRPLFPTLEGVAGTTVGFYEAIDMSDENGLRLAFHNGEIWFTYTGLKTGKRFVLIYDERRSRWRDANFSINLGALGVIQNISNMFYAQPGIGASLLMGSTALPGGTVTQVLQLGAATQKDGGITSASAPILCEVFTGASDQGRPLNLKEYMALIVDLDPGGVTLTNPVKITPYINGDALAEATVQEAGTGRQRVPIPLNQAGVELYGYNIAFDVTWNTFDGLPILYQYEVLYRHEPAEVTHWELPPTTFGQQGWMHVRDIYIMMRSNAPVTLNVLIPDEGVVQTFLLPSTGGTKFKAYVQLGPNKAKAYAFTIDSTAPFRIYADESEVRVKQWLTKLGYVNVPVIGREQAGRPFGQVNV